MTPIKVISKSIIVQRIEAGRCVVTVYVDGKVSAAYGAKSEEDSLALAQQLADNDCVRRDGGVYGVEREWNKQTV